MEKNQERDKIWEWPGDEARSQMHTCTVETGLTLHGCFTCLQIIYVNIDDFKSCVRILASQFSSTYNVRTVFNQDIA